MTANEIRRSFKDKLFQYDNYVSYLKAYFRYRKQLDPRFSMQIWSQSLQLGTRSYLSRILSGDRHPGDEMIERFCAYFKFTEKECEYFEAMVKLQKVKGDSRLSELVGERIRDLNPKRKTKILEHDSFEIMTNWYYFTIREMVNLKNFVEDSEWISEKLNFEVNPVEVVQAIDQMLNVGLLKRSPRTRKLRQSEPNIGTTEEIPSELCKIHHSQNLQNADHALWKLPVEDREFTSVCMNISESDVLKLKKDIREFKKKMIERYEKNQGEKTIQLQMQFFPYTGALENEA